MDLYISCLIELLGNPQSEKHLGDLMKFPYVCFNSVIIQQCQNATISCSLFSYFIFCICDRKKDLPPYQHIINYMISRSASLNIPIHITIVKKEYTLFLTESPLSVALAYKKYDLSYYLISQNADFNFTPQETRVFHKKSLHDKIKNCLESVEQDFKKLSKE